MKELLQKQNERILVLQMLVEALVEDLIETKKVKEKKLDARFISKMKWINEEMDKVRQKHQKPSNPLSAILQFIIKSQNLQAFLVSFASNHHNNISEA